jgi:hypothetical protein
LVATAEGDLQVIERGLVALQKLIGPECPLFEESIMMQG